MKGGSKYFEKIKKQEGFIIAKEMIEKIHNKYLHNDVKEINEDVLSFLYYHYMSKREDTDFWKKFTINNVMPDKLKNVLKSEDIIGNLKQYNFNMFNENSWQAIKNGINYV
jgi:hypothetical protein